MVDVVLKPIMSLLPARKQAARKGKPAAPTGPAASMHHLLYAMRDLNPRFVAIAADLRVVKWPHGSTDRPEIDAHVPEELLVKQRDVADDTAAAKAKRQRRKEKAARKRHRESVRRSRRLRREGGATPDEASPSPTAADADNNNNNNNNAGDDTDDDGAAAAVEDLRKREQQREKERKKRMKGQQTWGFCLTHKGTVTFVDPDGLTKLSATVNRRDMERIEVCGARHCVDASIKGVTVTIVWSLPTNEIQKATKARDRFKAVAEEVLPDVEYADVTPPDEDSDDEPSSELSDDDDDHAAKEPSAAAVEERTEGGEEGEGGPFVDDYEEEEEEEQESDASTEYEEEQEAPEPDEEPLDIAATVALLKRARDTSADTNRRIFEAQKWLADNPLATGAAADAREQQRLWADSAHSHDGTDAAAAAAAAAASRDRVLTDRERGLRLSLLVALICDKQRWLHAAAQQRAGDHSIRARYLQSGRRAREASSAPGSVSGSGLLSAGGDAGGRFGGALGDGSGGGAPPSSGFR